LAFRDVRLTEYLTTEIPSRSKVLIRVLLLLNDKKLTEENLTSQRGLQKPQILNKEDFLNQINLRSSFKPTSEVISI